MKTINRPGFGYVIVATLLALALVVVRIHPFGETLATIALAIVLVVAAALVACSTFMGGATPPRHHRLDPPDPAS